MAGLSWPATPRKPRHDATSKASWQSVDLNINMIALLQCRQVLGPQFRDRLIETQLSETRYRSHEW